jgi:hypothetical protein
MSPACFALVFNSPFKKLSAEFPEVSIISVHDDLTVVGDARVIYGPFLIRMNELLPHYKLRAQPDKSEAYTTDTSRRTGFPSWVKRPCVEWVDD